MKIAIQVSGQPRFIREFNTLLENIQGYDQVDWFFHLWTNSHAEDNRISPKWQSKNVEWVKSKITKHLPSGHKIADIQLVEPLDFTPTRDYNMTIWSVPKDMLSMWYGIKEVNQLREDYEKIHGNYDLVIRARADIGISKVINCREVASYLTSNPNNIIIPANHRYGLNGRAVSDLFAIGLRQPMSVYCGVFDHISEYTDIGLLFTNETMLAHHLTVHDINTPMTDFYHLGRGFGTVGIMPEDSPLWTYWGERGGEPDWSQWDEE